MIRSRGLVAALLAAVMVLGLTAWAAAAGPEYYVVADVVRGAKNPTGPSCVQTNMFKLGEQVVWRAEVFDAKTGKVLGKADVERLDLKVEGQVEGVGEFAMKFGPHPKQAPQVDFWAGAWDIPALYKTGTFKWTIVVTDKNGNKVVFEPVAARRPEMSGSWLIVEKR